MKFRGRQRGILALKAEFLPLENCFDRMEMPKEHESVGVEIDASMAEVSPFCHLWSVDRSSVSARNIEG